MEFSDSRKICIFSFHIFKGIHPWFGQKFEIIYRLLLINKTDNNR